MIRDVKKSNVGNVCDIGEQGITLTGSKHIQCRQERKGEELLKEILITGGRVANEILLLAWDSASPGEFWQDLAYGRDF